MVKQKEKQKAILKKTLTGLKKDFLTGFLKAIWTKMPMGKVITIQRDSLKG